MKKVLFFALIAMVAIACQTREKKTDSSSAEEVLTPVAYELVIEGMTCSGCEATVEGSVNKLEGIKMMDADYLKGNAIVEYFAEKSDTSLIRKAITESGYMVVAIKPVEKSEEPG